MNFQQGSKDSSEKKQQSSQKWCWGKRRKKEMVLAHWTVTCKTKKCFKPYLEDIQDLSQKWIIGLKANFTTMRF